MGTSFHSIQRTYRAPASVGGSHRFRKVRNTHKPSSGIAYYRIGARWYDPDLGLWTSVDPARQFPSPYEYGGNNPVNKVDPDGKAVGPNIPLNVIVNSPSAFYNMYQAEKTSAESGDGYWTTVGKGEFTFLATLAIGAPVPGASSLVGASALGGLTSLAGTKELLQFCNNSFSWEFIVFSAGCPVTCV